MMVIGCDFHMRYKQIAMLDDATGELTERRLEPENGETGCPGSRPACTINLVTA